MAEASMQQNSRKFRLLICGAGVAGLALAQALCQPNKQSFIEFDIIEKDTAFEARKQGYSLTIQDNGQKVLQSLGLLEALQQHEEVCVGRGHTMYAPDGTITKIRSILLTNLQNLVQWGVSVSEFHNTSEFVQVKFSTGETKQYDLVVAGEGVFSKFRQQLVGDPLVYLGVVMINGIIEDYIQNGQHQNEGSRSYSVLDSGENRLFYKPYKRGYLMWQLTHTLPEQEAIELGKSTQAPELWLQKALEYMQGWKHEIVAHIAATKLELLRCGALYARNPIPDNVLENGFQRVVMVGDAAHPMPPFKGQGANQALEDAYELAELLQPQIVEENSACLLEKIKQYQQHIVKRASKVQLQSIERVVLQHNQK